MTKEINTDSSVIGDMEIATKKEVVDGNFDRRMQLFSLFALSIRKYFVFLQSYTDSIPFH